MNGFSPVRITLLGSAVLMGVSSFARGSRASMALPPRASNRGGQSGRAIGGRCEAVSKSAPMKNRLKPVDGRGNPRRPRLDLQGKLEGEKPRLLQVGAMKPERFLLCGPPHVPELAFPRAGIFAGIGSEAPTFADLVGEMRADQLRGTFGHGAIAGGIDDEVGRQRAAVA